MSNTSINAQVDRATHPLWEAANAASAEPFQSVTSQLLAFFRT